MGGGTLWSCTMEQTMQARRVRCWPGGTKKEEDMVRFRVVVDRKRYVEGLRVLLFCCCQGEEKKEENEI